MQILIENLPDKLYMYFLLITHSSVLLSFWVVNHTRFAAIKTWVINMHNNSIFPR